MSFRSLGFRGVIPRALIVLAAGLAACQQGVVPGNGYDKPLLSLSGAVLPQHTIPAMITDANGMDHDTKPIMGVLWTDPLQRVPDLPQPARGIGSHVDPASDTFTIDIYGPPPAQAMVEIPSPGGSAMRLAFGEIVMIHDQNGDGTFQVSGTDATIGGGDRYLAGANTVIVYLDQSYTSLPPGTVVAASGKKGYQVVFYVCDQQSIKEVHAQNPGGILAYTQPSITFPDVRTCGRTHSP